MPFNKDQLKDYWQTNKEALNRKRREKRRLAKSRLATSQVSQVEPLEVSHGKPENGKPESKNVEPCSHCPELERQIKELEKQLDAVATLPATYIDGLLEDERKKHGKEIEKLTQQIQELQKPINPAIELWKKRYLDLQKEFYQKGTEQTETINRLKEKLREKDKEKQQLIQKYSKGENQAQNKGNYQQIPQQSHFTSLFYDKEHKKFVLHDCPDPCWQGKYCSNCGLFSSLRP